MSDEPKGDHAHFWFMVPKDPAATHYSFALKYRDVSMSVKLEDNEDSLQDLRDLLRSVMPVAEKARNEKVISRAVGEMDADLSELLEDD